MGHLHLISQIRRRMEDIFVGLGFSVLEGPEIEYEYYNFTALNHPPEHPARLPQDTFYLAERVLLRTHTSPMQVRAMELQEPPIYIVVPGRVYRPDTPDATHVPMFHQLEGLAIDEDITLADLQGVLLAFARQMFGEATEVRLRPGYFPFTEPSVEVDVSCFRCAGTGKVGGERCPTCRGEGWIEILGSGMVDPNVLGYVAANGYDPDGCRASRSAWASSASRCSCTRCRTCGCCSRTTSACWSSSGPGHEGAARMAALVLRPRRTARSEIADALTMSGDKLERLDHVGVGDPAGFVVGRVLEAERHPDADRLSVCVVDDGSGEPRTIVCGAPNVAAGPDRGRGAARAPTMPDGTQARRGQAPRGPLERDDPGRGRGRDRHRPRRDHGAGRRTSRRATRWPATCRSRTRCSSSR